MFSLDLLEEAQTSNKGYQNIIAISKQDDLIRTLSEFKIKAKADRISVGPTVTRIEFQLSPGILLSKVEKLMPNIAMALSVPSVSFVKSIPGKTTIAVEIANDKAEMVTLREIIESDQYKNSKGKLTFALGKDLSGVNHVADLRKMPHLLVGGSTNSGKSAFLNSLITSIIFRATPKEVQFVMIDPKRVELSFYKDIPHLLTPVITDMSDAAKALNMLIVEMERRFELFVGASTRDIENYNEKVDDNHKLPFIVLVVDELAELMMTKRKEVEPAICRLAQLARATGIHLVLATQRPSVDVITGLMKSNITSRIAFSVAQGIDSRTILDEGGAENLIGKGDMIFKPIGNTQPIRIQGCYISENETHAIVESIKATNKPVRPFTKVVNKVEDMLAGCFGSGKTSIDEAEEIMPKAIIWAAGQRGFNIQNIQNAFNCSYDVSRRVLDTLKVFCIVYLDSGVHKCNLNESQAKDFVKKHYV